jgi:hypothetical protein
MDGLGRSADLQDRSTKGRFWEGSASMDKAQFVS